MMSRPTVYPFVPESTASLLPGHCWALPLCDGSYGCGRVIQLAPREARGARFTFLGAVMDWVSSMPPTADAISGAECVAQGHVHIKAITETGGAILGHRPLELDRVAPWLFRGAEGWQNSFVQEGLNPIRAQTPDDGALPVLATWGYQFAVKIAETRFVTKRGTDKG